MTAAPRALLLVLILYWPGAALADDSAATAEAEGDLPGDDTADSEDVEDAAPATATDPITARILELVALYYTEIDVVPTDEERARGLESGQMMLLSGVAVTDITKAVGVAIRLHTPGRRVPFEIAVPLRVGTSMTTTDVAYDGTTPAQNPIPKADLEASFSPEEKARRTRIREAEAERRARYSLYRQWRSRTLIPRTLLTVGIPTLATGYITGFAVAGGILLSGGPLTHQQAWLTAIPIFGPAILAGVGEGLLDGMAISTAIQGCGAALIAVALVVRKKFPKESDPTALRLGKKRDGRPAVVLHFRPSPTGAGLVGRF